MSSRITSEQSRSSAEPSWARAVDLRMEQLEGRTMLAAAPVVAIWDGGGDGASWQDARNWAADVLPLTDADVRFEVPASVRLTGEVTARSLMALQGLSLGGGTLHLTGDAGVLNGFNLHAAAALRADGSVSVTGGDIHLAGLLSGSSIGIDALMHDVTSKGARVIAGNWGPNGRPVGRPVGRVRAW
jgi:hypothetical protein